MDPLTAFSQIRYQVDRAAKGYFHNLVKKVAERLPSAIRPDVEGRLRAAVQAMSMWVDHLLQK